MKAKLRKPIHPDTFQLVTNYRSHGGIVDCAVSLIELLGQIQLGMSIGRHYFFAVLIEEIETRFGSSSGYHCPRRGCGVEAI